MQQLHKKQYRYSQAKDAVVMQRRQICFKDVIDIITSGNALGIRKHPSLLQNSNLLIDFYLLRKKRSYSVA